MREIILAYAMGISGAVSVILAIVGEGETAWLALAIAMFIFTISIYALLFNLFQPSYQESDILDDIKPES